MAGYISWYDSDGVTPLSPFSFGQVLDGTTSDPWEFIAKNDGDETIYPEFWMAPRNPVGEFQSNDPSFLGGWWQIALIGAGGGASTQVTSYTPVGDGMTVASDPIPPGGYRVLSAVLAVPFGAAEVAAGSVAPFARYAAGAGALWRYQYSAGLGGVVFRRDVSASYLVEFTGLEFSGLDLSFDYEIHRFKGEPRASVGFSSTLSASSSSMERFVTVSAGESGVTLTDGDEVAEGTSTESDKPSAPAGEQILGYALVDDTEILSTEDVSLTGREARVRAGAGTTVDVDPGSVFVGDAWVSVIGGNVELEDDETSVVGISRSGSPVAWVEADGRAVEAEPLAIVEVASGSVVDAVDIRRRPVRPVELSGYKAGAIAANDVLGAGLWASGIGYFRPEMPYRIELLDTGGTAGVTTIEFQVWTGTWDALFSADIAYDAATGSAVSVAGSYPPPEISMATRLLPGTPWRIVATAVPTTPSEDAFVSVFMEEH